MNRKVSVPKEKVHYWPQYAEEFYKVLDRAAVRENADASSPVHMIPDDEYFNIIFTGNIGTAQGLEILKKMAELLKFVNVRFVIVGGGRYHRQFMREIKLEWKEYYKKKGWIILFQKMVLIYLVVSVKELQLQGLF